MLCLQVAEDIMLIVLRKTSLHPRRQHLHRSRREAEVTGLPYYNMRSDTNADMRGHSGQRSTGR